MKRFVLIAIMFLACLTSFGQMSVSFNFKESDFEIAKTEKCAYINSKLPKSRTVGGTDAPRLPYFVYKVILPKDASENLAYTADYSPRIIVEQVKICANPRIVPRNNQLGQENSTRIAKSSVLNPVSFGGYHTIDGIRFAYFKVTPFIYNANNETLSFVPEIRISFPSIENERKTSGREVSFMDKYVRNQFVNPEDFYAFYPEMANPQEEEISQAELLSNADAEQRSYNIVTSLRNKVDYLIISGFDTRLSFSTLRNWKQKKGLRAHTVSISNLADYYHTTVTPEVIKQYLNDIGMYSTGTKKKYLVLGGDVDLVPTMYYELKDGFALQIFGMDITDTIPSDIYYACPNLTATNDGTTNVDDLAPQLYVSRIPAHSIGESNRISQKIVDYEKGGTDGGNMLLAAYKINESCYQYSDAGYALNRIDSDFVQPNWNESVYKLYDKGTTEIINKDRLFNHINNSYGIVLENSHGDYDRWLFEEEDNTTHYTSSLASSQSNYPGSVILTGACLTNAFDFTEGNCLSEEFIINSGGGAVAYWGTSRFGYGAETDSDYRYSSSEYSDLYNGKFLEHLFTGDIADSPYSFGVLTSNAKKDLIPDVTGNVYYTDLMHSINAIGDPEMQIYTDTPQTFDDSELPYIFYDCDYVTITAHTDCVISAVSFDLSYSFTQNMQAGNTIFRSLPGGGYICMKKKNHIPYTYSAYQIPYEDEIESGSLRRAAGSNRTNDVFIENSSVNNADDKDWKIEIYNALTGQKVSSGKEYSSSYRIDMSGWPKGLYVLKAYKGEQVIISKTTVK